MEKLHTTQPRELSGNRTLHLMTIIPSGPDNNDQQPENVMNRNELMEEFVFGDGLANVDTLIVNGSNALERLPRPDAFGNSRLALMAILDAMTDESMMTLVRDEESE